jgi:hypothetical protein
VRCAFFAIIVGEVFMVVMDLVDGRDAYRAFGHRDLLLDRVKLGLEKLHDADLVFGDVRRPNIRVGEKAKANGVRSSWTLTGPVGIAKCPPMLNTSGEVLLHPPSQSAAEIKKHHGIDM